jgi:hypothetical protein
MAIKTRYLLKSGGTQDIKTAFFTDVAEKMKVFFCLSKSLRNIEQSQNQIRADYLKENTNENLISSGVFLLMSNELNVQVCDARKAQHLIGCWAHKNYLHKFYCFVTLND